MYPGRGRAAFPGQIAGNLWLFGGYVINRPSGEGHLNNLWKFEGSSNGWTLADGLPDFDGDGATDLLWRRTSTSARSVTLMTGGVPRAYQYVGGAGDSDLGIVELE